MHYLVYKITNTKTNKIYVGVHRTSDINDGYMGSGNLVKKAIRKHGIDNFTKEILYDFDNPEDMFMMEAEIVDGEFVCRGDTYNMKIGGCGGWNLDPKMISDNTRRRMHNLRKDPIAFSNHVDNLIKISPRGVSSFMSKYPNGTWKGRKHTEETKIRMSESNRGKQAGSNNSQYGTCWIFSNEEKRSMKIQLEELQEWISSGWIKGRKFKF